MSKEVHVIFKRTLALGAVFALILPLGVFCQTQEKPKMDPQMMEIWMKFATPNENHDYFRKFIGTWDMDSTFWMQPGAEPEHATITSEIKTILGGRFMHAAFKGTMMGQPYEGLQIVGYDNFQNKYITFWIDNSSTAFYLTSGTMDESGKVLTETGVWPDPITGGSTQVRAVTTRLDEDSFMYEMFMAGADGEEFKVMENIARRKTQKISSK